MIENIKWTGAVIVQAVSKLTKNTVWILVLNIVIAISQFVVYSFINKRLGTDALGVWSLVVAATSIGQISSFGFSNSLVRYLPELISQNDRKRIQLYLGTINRSIFFITLPILLLLYIP